MLATRLGRLGIANSSNPASPQIPVPLESDAAGPLANLTPAEIALIQSASEGWIRIEHDDKYGRYVGDFLDDEDVSYQAIHLDALESLVVKKLVRPDSPDAFRLTGRGHEIQKSLESARGRN
jgi:hypothetical protein